MTIGMSKCISVGQPQSGGRGSGVMEGYEGTEAGEAGRDGRPIFEPLRTKRAFEEISAEIKRLIFSDKLKPGDRLPSEIELAGQFGVSRHTIREALRGLEIRSQAVPQVYRLAHVEHLAAAVFEEVDAAGPGYFPQGRGQGRIGSVGLYFGGGHLIFRIAGGLRLSSRGKP